jgi:hypothetical protein
MTMLMSFAQNMLTVGVIAFTTPVYFYEMGGG